MTSLIRDGWQHACTCEPMTRAGSTARVEESSVPTVTTGAVGRRLQCPGCGRRRDLIMEEIHGISKSIPFGWHQHEEATSSVNCLHHYGVEGATACQGSSWIHSVRCHINNTNYIIVCSPDEKGHGRVHTGLASRSRHPKELSFPIHHKSWGKQLQFCYRTTQLQE